MILLDHIHQLFIASDHAGLILKNYLIQHHPQLPWVDLGPQTEDSVDYPDYADLLSAQIRNPQHAGVLICGSGQGMAIRANRHRHIRAALCWHEEITRLARAHNNANVLCLGSRTIDFKISEKCLMTFLTTAFEGGRHQIRVDKLGIN